MDLDVDTTAEYYWKGLMPDQCASCGKVEDGVALVLRKCSRCKVAKYCSVDCQSIDWACKHKKGECKEMKQKRDFFIQFTNEDATNNNATGVFILATRLARGQDGDPRDTNLAVELYEKAAGIQAPIPGGHDYAMIYLGFHYERGIGVKQQDYEQARYWYNRVLYHPGRVVGSMYSALLAMSRLYREGLGVEQSDEEATRYDTLARMGCENGGELKQGQEWWEANKAAVLAEAAAERGVVS